MEAYIVRIYRRDENNPGIVAGIVEVPGEIERKAFTNSEELLNILCGNMNWGQEKGAKKKTPG